MKDIRRELKDRLDQVEEKYTELIDQLEDLDAKMVAINTLLGLEEKKYGPLDVSTENEKRISPTMPTGEFILMQMADGKFWATADLRDTALNAGLLRMSSSPGRSIQGALMGLIKQGKVESAGDGTWALTEKYLANQVSEALK